MNKKIILISGIIIFFAIAGVIRKVVYDRIYESQQRVVSQNIQQQPQGDLKPANSSSPPAPSDRPATKNCISNSAPVFTHHVTDLDKVSFIVPPPTMGKPRNLKAHGYFQNITNGGKVPVYAPTDMRLIHGGYVGGDYYMNFKASCEVLLRFGHITDPVESIKKLFPELQTDSSWKDLPLESQLSFKSGDLIAYTSGTAAGSWDFGVLNSTILNRYANDPMWNNSTSYTTAVCPYDYFTLDLRALYYAKFNPTGFAGNPPDGESFCKY